MQATGVQVRGRNQLAPSRSVQTGDPSTYPLKVTREENAFNTPSNCDGSCGSELPPALGGDPTAFR